MSRGRIYDNSTGSKREKRHRGGDLLSTHSAHDAPLYFRCTSRLRFILNAKKRRKESYSSRKLYHLKCVIFFRLNKKIIYLLWNSNNTLLILNIYILIVFNGFQKGKSCFSVKINKTHWFLIKINKYWRNWVFFIFLNVFILYYILNRDNLIYLQLNVTIQYKCLFVT